VDRDRWKVSKTVSSSDRLLKGSSPEKKIRTEEKFPEKIPQRQPEQIKNPRISGKILQAHP
jgi:hypothetical protein